MRKKHKLLRAAFINSKITTTISISLVLFLLGLVVFLSLFANNLSDYVKESLSFDIILQDNINKQQIQHLQNTLNKAPFTKSINYVSKEKAIKQLASELGQNPEEFLGFNPLPDLFIVHLKSQYTNPDSLVVIKTYLKKFSNDIQKTEYREETLQIVTDNITKIGFILLIIASVLLFISFALINNTIRLAVYAKRFLIRTMQLVGAKKRFIRKPFIISNIFMGIVASFIASGLLYWIIDYTANNFPDINKLLDLNSILMIFGSVIALGISITFIVTYFAVNKYINADIDDLYTM